VASITLGPVLGKVDHESARVLVEVDTDVELQCIAEPARGEAVDAKRRMRADRPGALELEGLEPDTTYTLRFQGATSDTEGRVHTLPKAPRRLDVGAVSCNFFGLRGERDLWENLYRRYVEPKDSRLDLLLHVGDQVYGDVAFQEATTILDGKPRGTARQEQQILEAYRRLYRTTWRHRPTREVLARVSNLMIWDDHEIRDDWGNRVDDRDPDSGAHWIGTLARRVYREYQRQLWDQLDVDATPTSGFEHHLHRFGEIGIAFLDLRGGRTFERDTARPFLGTPQWESLQGALAADGVFGQVRALVVVSAVPLVYLGRAAAGVGSLFTDNLQDHWSYGDHRKEQLELLRALRRWKDAAPGRELVIVAGDAHVGGHTEIFHEDTKIFEQLVTSPITNKPPPEYLFQGLAMLLAAQREIGGRYRALHGAFTCRRNYGIVTIRVPEDTSEPAYVEAALETE
jgi:phosphodiesterase/alkaline phosphatase D-like protein